MNHIECPTCHDMIDAPTPTQVTLTQRDRADYLMLLEVRRRDEAAGCKFSEEPETYAMRLLMDRQYTKTHAEMLMQSPMDPALTWAHL